MTTDFTKLVGKTFSRVYKDSLGKYTFLGSAKLKDKTTDDKDRFLIADINSHDSSFAVDRKKFMNGIREGWIIFDK